jgi:hypothetical protein
MTTIQVKVLLLYIVDFYLDAADEDQLEQNPLANRFIRVLDQFPSELVDKISNDRINVSENPITPNNDAYIDFLFFIAEDFASSIEIDSLDKQILSLTQEAFPNLDELSLVSVEATLEVVLTPEEEDTDVSKTSLTNRIEEINFIRFDNIKRVSSSWVKV